LQILGVSRFQFFGFFRLQIVGLISSSLVLGFPICILLGLRLGFLVNKLLWSRLGFLVYIILLRFGDIVSMHGYLNVFVYSLYVHNMPKFASALYAHQVELSL